MTQNADGAYENVFMNVGNRGDRGAYTRTLAAPTWTQHQPDNLYDCDGFAAKIIDKPAEEMTRAGYCIEGIDDGDDVIADLEKISTTQKLAQAIKWSDLYGGALIVLLVNDGGEFDQPLRPDAAKEIEQIRVYDRWQVSRHRLYQDPADKRFGQTEIYHIAPSTGNPYTVHESRCIALDGMECSPRRRDINDGWGVSRLQKAYDQLERMNMAHYWSNALIERAQQAVHGIPDLTGLLSQPGGEELVKTRLNLVDMSRCINNTVVIDSQESYDIKSTSFSGVTDIVDRLGLALCAVTGFPESVMFGRQQGGLNSTGAADMQQWYAHIEQRQHIDFLPALRRIVDLQLRIMGKWTADFEIECEPLYVPSAKETSDVELNRAKTAEIYVNMQAVDPSEIRQTLREDGPYEIDDTEIETGEPEVEIED